MIPSLYFRYLSTLYLKNLLAILLGLSFAFASIDYFQHSGQFGPSFSSKILYIYYMWQEALGILYPLSIVFALIMTKFSLIKHNTMGALHAFGYSKKRLSLPLMSVAMFVYVLFMFLHMTEFSYAKDKAGYLLKNELHAYNVNDLFFKYNDNFVYIKKLDPVNKTIEDMTIFRVNGFQVESTIHTPRAAFDGKEWDAYDATIKRHIYQNGILQRYTIEHQEHINTLEGYKPKIIKSFYEGESLTLIDAFNTYRLLLQQHIDSDKIRAVFYDKVIVPLFAPALLLILFFKLPFHGRMMQMGKILAISLGMTFITWGMLFGFRQLGQSGVVLPEATAIVPVLLLWVYAVYVYLTDEKKIA
ncbi:MAG: LptF/LptG family permease [Campylobacterales bacterium]|nr:LptF/LptG family permease [Campylobacterales bacterium]